MHQPRVFCVKLQLHFGGDVHEISVPAYNGAEPTVFDLMNVVERDFRVPRALQTLVFHGQEMHSRPSEPLSRFGIKNLATVRLVGRMAPPDMIQQINAQLNPDQYQTQTSYYTQQQQQWDPNTADTYHTNEQSFPYYQEHFQHERKPSVGTQYDPPPPSTPNREQPPPTPNREQPPPTPNREQPPPTPNREQPPPTPNREQTPITSNRERTSERQQSQSDQQKPPPTPNSTNGK